MLQKINRFNEFQERVYPDEIDYGNLLYIQMREDAVGLDERQFMNAGNYAAHTLQSSYPLFILVYTRNWLFLRNLGTKILGLTSAPQQLEYYFQVFSEGEEAITRECKYFGHLKLKKEYSCENTTFNDM